MKSSLAVVPRVAIWEMTRACDLACRHCRAHALPARDPRELSVEEGDALIGQLRALSPGVVVLTGGDPLKRPDLFAWIGHAVEVGLNVAVAPSVTPALTAGAIARLARSGVCRIALSLDGPDAATHDALRGTPGSFAATCAAIAAVRDTGMSLQINTSLTCETIATLPATGALVAAIAPSLWSVFFVVPVGRATSAARLSAAACERAFNHLDDWSVTTGLAAKTTAAPAYRRVRIMRGAARGRTGKAPPGSAPLAVNDGKGFVFVSHTGEVYPSGFLPLSAGNVRATPLADIYRTRPLFRALRDDWRLEGKCGVCPFRAVCGGSRARAYAVTGNPFAEDPACAYEPPAVARVGIGSQRPEAGAEGTTNSELRSRVR